MKPKVENMSPQGVDKDKSQADSDQEMMNLDNEIYSLTHYADDEEELVAQMFATIKGSKLDAMMPPILKEISLIDLQQLCLHELRGMSQRRILSIINGQEMSGSSSEDSDNDRKVPKQDDNEDSNMGKSMEEGEDFLAGKDLADLENPNDPNLTALDLLELEMRAKLIKTMLEKQDGDDPKKTQDEMKGIGYGFVPDIKIKEEPLSPESSKMKDGRDEDSPRRGRRRKYPRHRRRSGSRSYSSSYSRSRSSSYSYSSRSSRSRSRTYSSMERKKSGSETSESKKPPKKKLTKREFEARMRKARMNRSYRKRKDSEEESGAERKQRGRAKTKTKTKIKEEKKESGEKDDAPESEIGTEVKEKEEGEEGEEGEAEAADEEIEKEEGEIDSNEEGAISSSDRSSRSRSYSSYSSYSSRSRSYSRSPSRKSSRRRRKHRKSKKYRRRSDSSRSHSDDVPKIPNWQPPTNITLSGDEEAPKKSEEPEAKDEETLPEKEDRQSISFSFSKKSAIPIKSNPELNDDGLPNVTQTKSNTPERTVSPLADPTEHDDVLEQDTVTTNGHVETEENDVDHAVVMSDEVKEEVEVEVEKETKVEVEEDDREIKESNKKQSAEETVADVAEPGEVMEDFYKGADQLSFSEEEGEEEPDLEKLLNDDTPVEPIQIAENTVKKSVSADPNQDESLPVSWENKKDILKGDLASEGVSVLKTDLPEPSTDSLTAIENSSEATKELESPENSQMEGLLEVGEESSQDVLEALPDTEPEDSQGSHNLEIIGVIDPKDSENQEELFDEGGSSWSMRWLQSDKVQKVVSNSKILSKMRKNIQAKGKAIVKESPKAPIKIVAPVEPKPTPEVPVKKVEARQPVPTKSSGSNVIGSIEEYEKLFGIRVKAPTSLPQPKSATKPPATGGTSTAGLLDSDDEEDSEEEALWSKIMKK